MRKIGMMFQGVPGLSDEEFAKEMSALGFQTTFSMVFDKERQEKIANILAKNGIEYETLHSRYSHINDMWLDCDGGDEMLAELKQSVDICVVANTPIMVVHMSSGNTPPTVTDIGRARYQSLVDYAMQKNVRIAFENIRKTAHIAWAMETFEDNPMVGFCWDCGHEACYQNGREFMPFYGNKLLCTHIHDNCGETDADEHLIPFDGVVNYERFAEHIRNSGFKGSLMLEVHNYINRYDDLTVPEFMAKAEKAARRLVEMTDGK